MAKPQFQSTTDIVRRLARSRGVTFEFAYHAELEMRADNITRLDVQNALSNCKVNETQDDEPFLKHVCVGRDTEERKITIVVEMEEKLLRIFVVTAWK